MKQLSKNKLFAIFNLFYVGNIAYVIILLAMGLFPYPALWPDEVDAQNDFFSICYFTLNKVSNYGSFRDIYPPLGHFYCWLTQVFYPHLMLTGNYMHAKLSIPDALPSYILMLGTAYSLYYLYKRLANFFELKNSTFIFWSWISTSPFIFLIDRSNFMMVGLICINMMIPLFLTEQTRSRRILLIILAGVPIGIKPYMILPMIAFPVFALYALLSAIAQNLVVYLLWRPPALRLIIQNILHFTDPSIVIPSIPGLIVDGLAWTSPMQYIKLLLKTLDANYDASLNTNLAYVLLLVAICLYFAYQIISVRLLYILYVKSKINASYLFKLPAISNSEVSVYKGSFVDIRSVIFFLSSYLTLFSIIPLFTKSLYWYSVVHMIPPLMFYDILLLAKVNLYSRLFICTYQIIKILTFTIIVPPMFSRVCLNDPAQITIFKSFLGALELPVWDNTYYKCFVPTIFNIVHFLIRMINLPLLSLMSCFIAIVYINHLGREHSHQA